MAWTPEKNQLLRDMVYERVRVEGSESKYLEWGLNRSVIQIVNSYITNVQKQSILNDLIDDKVIYFNKVITAQQTSASAMITSRDSLITLKE